MNTNPTIKASDEETAVGDATASIPLDQETQMQEQSRNVERSDLIHKRALNELTGASIRVAPRVPAEGISEITTKRLDPDKVIRTNSAY